MITVRRIQLLSIVFGLIVSGYLSYLKLVDAPSVCLKTGPFNCDVVLNSRYSELAGVPIAWLGLAVYLILGAVQVLENRYGIAAQFGVLVKFGIGLFAWLFSMWLVYVQVALLGALCPWCLSHEINFTLLFGLICLQLYRDMTAPHNKKRALQ